MSERALTVAAVGAFVIGVALMIPFEATLTRIVGVACLIAFIVFGAFAIATPRRLGEQSDAPGQE